jgi:ketosteroid isomerase-like protein
VASANLDFVRSICADWPSGDYGSAEWAHPEIEYVIADGPSPGDWRGLAGMAQGLRDLLSATEDWRIEADEYRELDDERILVLLHAISGRGKTSGLEVGHIRTNSAYLFHIRDGKVTRLVFYWDRERALTELWRESYEGWARGS